MKFFIYYRATPSRQPDASCTLVKPKFHLAIVENL
jgi:hypothetical protein